MQLHELKSPKGSKKRKRIVGRGPGSGRGKTSGRGQKGQMSRSGHWSVKGSEGGQVRLIRRLPKMGFRSHRPVLYQVVNVEKLNHLKKDATVTAQSLKENGLIESLQRPFKILGDGDLKKAIIVQEGCVSKTAREKIEKAGGKIQTQDTRLQTLDKKKKKVPQKSEKTEENVTKKSKV